MSIEFEKWFESMGYRRYQSQPQQVKIFYRFYPEGFQVCLFVDETGGFVLTPQQHTALEERVLDLFYHPEGRLPGFPEGYPVYRVERLTIVAGRQMESIHNLCTSCENVWGIFEPEHRLIIYENQPGDLFGLKKPLEECLTRSLTNRRKTICGVTTAIAATNVIVFLILYFMSGRSLDAVFVVMHGGLFSPYVLERGEWWRILTAMFIHFDANHLLNNMVIFCCVGAILERALGHVKYLIVYVLSGIGGGLLSLFMMLHTEQIVVSAGASGAVFGVIGGLFAVVLLHRGRYEGLTGKGVLFMVLLSLYYGISTAGVDNWAHVGGLVTGFVLTLFLSITVQT